MDNSNLDNKIDIYVATHKDIHIKLPDIYKKVEVNCALTGQHWKGYYHDDYGADNISIKNQSYCELTAMYSEWKYSHADIKGLVHYRRFFINDDKPPYSTAFIHLSNKNLIREILKDNDIKKTLQKSDIILPMPYLPYPSTARKDLELYCYKKDIDIFCQVMNNYYPEYDTCFDMVMSSTNLAYCNMFIARKKVFDDYCQWMFDILSKVEKQCDISSYDPQHKRIFGYLSEVLINVYVYYHKLKVKYFNVAVPYQYTDGTIRLFLSQVIWQHRTLRYLMSSVLKDKSSPHYKKREECLKKAMLLDKNLHAEQ